MDTLQKMRAIIGGEKPAGHLQTESPIPTLEKPKTRILSESGYISPEFTRLRPTPAGIERRRRRLVG
jgi:hypothetical protein